MAFWNKKDAAPVNHKRRQQLSIRSAITSWAAAEINNLTKSWTKTNKPINEEIQGSLETTRARARDLAKNDVHVKKFMRLVKTNVIGRKGIILQSKVKNSDGTVDTVASNAIELAWKEWGKWGVANAKGTGTFVEIQKMFWDHILRDGEVLIIKHKSRGINKFNYALQFLDPEVLSVKNNQDLRNGNKIRMSIEINSAGRVIAYHVTSTDTTHDTFYAFHGQGYIRIEAKRVIHRFFSEYADQVRGMPEIAVAMTRLKNLDGYEQAEIISKRVSAAKMGFFSRNAEGEGYEGEEQDDYVTMDASPGSIDELPNGVNFSTFDPTHDGGSYDSYVTSALRGIASGLGVSHHSLSSDLSGVNYSSGRLGALEDRDTFMSMQDWTIDCFLEPVFIDWLESSVLAGAIKIPSGGTLRATDIDRYKDCYFQGRRWLWVDPAKDMKANKDAIELRLTSLSAIIREQGRDPDEVFLEIAADKKRLEELGIYQEAEQVAELIPELTQEQIEQAKEDE